MAVIKKVKVSICSGGKKLQEYHPPDNDASPDMKDTPDDTLVKYIQGVSDANFTIAFRVGKKFGFGKANYLRFTVTVDGEHLGGNVCTKEDYQKGGSVWKHRYKGLTELSSNGQGVCYPLRWASLTSTEQSCEGQDIRNYQNLGTIKVGVWRMNGGKGTPKPKVRKGKIHDPVPEKAIKGEAIDLRANLDVPRPHKAGSFYKGTKVDDKPYAVFIFKYRSKESLEALGILERPQTPQPLEERDIETLSPDELKELARRLKAAQAEQKVKIKKENAESNLTQLADLERGRNDADDDEVEFVGEQPVKRVCIIGPVIE
ncbi:uncharacterized protein PV07_03942 [Cladophialophora immunda]|uniref:DUF7918 domain-containing protein n=1 Tax=Cladophialophora immunda TaxID=569365 RepID=A0A0D2B475_9EURO|nr:uncharacterized protein PV07_03942 [Cladophialophora immunda]KIW32392.1 hypothetical protein PV07_03942 [Cladophialophora immunda]OQV07436.1 hypothetical protein CLAIMM_11871 isoform 2 [Cladophialophora immunda]